MPFLPTAGEAPGFSFSRAASLAEGTPAIGLFLFQIIDPDHPGPRAVMPLRYPAMINGRIRSGCGCLKREGGMWRELVALTFLVLLLGAAIIANVIDGPMREHRGSWVAHASR